MGYTRPEAVAPPKGPDAWLEGVGVSARRSSGSEVKGMTYPATPVPFCISG